MKRIVCGVLLLLLLLTGCTVTIEPDGSDQISAPPPTRIREVSETALPTQPAGDDALTVPSTTGMDAPAEPSSDELSGVEMVLPEGLIATPGTPWVPVTISFPKVTLTGPAAERSCSLTVTLDGETVAEWPRLLLTSGQEKSLELEFSFDRYQEDRTAQLQATLTCDGASLVRETEIQVDNYPEEVYLAMTGDGFPYSIDVIRSQNVVIVYGRDDDDEYTVPVLACLCSTGRDTPTGIFSLGSKKEWGNLYGGVYGQYVCGIRGDILFHSVPYYRMGEKDSLETEEFNKLGTAASMGCVRLPVEDAKWIFDNCPSGTTVHIYDSEELPVERPTVQTLDPDDPRSGWDPTDPDENNPWNQ